MKLFKTSSKHLKETGWSYWQHLSHSIKQSNRLIVIAIKSYIHGIMPWMFVASGPVGVYKIYKEIKHMHHVQKILENVDDNS